MANFIMTIHLNRKLNIVIYMLFFIVLVVTDVESKGTLKLRKVSTILLSQIHEYVDTFM